MKQAQLRESLSELISGFGYEIVHKTLREIHAKKIVDAKRDAGNRCAIVTRSSAKPGKKRTKPNAVRVVKSIEITDDEKKEILFTMAKKYEAKEFMPNVNHVRGFLHSERDVSRIKSRQQVTSAVFKKLSALETSKLREILDRGLYGPPKRLESYARAIEGFDRQNRPA